MDTTVNPERLNFARIEDLERRLAELRGREPSSAADAIRESGLEIAIAVREVGAMLVNVGWEQAYGGTDGSDTPSGP
jgi:hypothetical protein